MYMVYTQAGYKTTSLHYKKYHKGMFPVVWTWPIMLNDLLLEKPEKGAFIRYRNNFE